MAGEQDATGQADDLGELIGWLEDERTKDLVDLINRAAQGKPVEEAAERYKARYRHSGSVDKLSDMFDSLQQQHEDGFAAIRLGGIKRQLESMREELGKLQLGFGELEQQCMEDCAAQTQLLQEIASCLREIDDCARGFRERIISCGSGDVHREESRLRIIGL